MNTELVAPLSYVRTRLEAVGTHPNVAIANLPFYNFYKDENGLYRRDQVDLTIGYERETRIGVLGGGIIASNRSAPRGKSNPFADSGANYQATEMYVSYALPFFTDLKFTWYGDVVNSDQRLEAEIGHEFELAEATSLSVSAVTGYAYRSGIHGWQDADLGADLSLSGFLLGVHWVYRPTLAFFDEDTDLTTNMIQFDGLSNRRDGLVSDPRRVGLEADYINATASGVVRQQTGNSIYTYTPRQKLPKWLSYVKLGYAMSF